MPLSSIFLYKLNLTAYSCVLVCEEKGREEVRRREGNIERGGALEREKGHIRNGEAIQHMLGK